MAAKLTQAKLAEELYISRTTLSGYENGKPISPNMIMKICAALHTDPNHLFGVDGASASSRIVDKDEFMKAAIKAAEEMYKELYR